MIGTLLKDAYDFSDLSAPALSEFGHVVAAATGAIQRSFQPKHIFVGRYGVAPGNLLHLHVVPVFDWLEKRIEADTRYSFLDQISEGSCGLRYDAADFLLYTWRELVERADRSGLPPIDLPSVVGVLKKQIQSESGLCG